MFERRPLLGLLIALTICVSIWRISLQEPFLTSTYVGYQHQQQYTIYRRRFSIPPTAETPEQHLNSHTTAKENLRNSSLINILTTSNNSKTLRNDSNVSSSTSLSVAVNPNVLPPGDLTKLINLYNFNFILNQEPCKGPRGDNLVNSKFTKNGDPSQSPIVLILIHSAPDNHMKRLLIRETWGSHKSSLYRLIFLLGAVNSTKTQHRLELENKMFSDIVQGNFIDAYRNMTYKHVMALKWFTYYCPSVKFILKIDDDVFVNTPFLLDLLNQRAPQRNLLFCQKQINSSVKRSYRSKWRVSKQEYAGSYYPPYCPGYAIVYSPDVAFRLYVEAQKSPYFWIDDVHITGTLAQQANINITSFLEYILPEGRCNDILSAGKTDKISFLFLFTWPDISEVQARKLWKLIENLR